MKRKLKQPVEVDTIAFETYRDDKMKNMWGLFLQSRGGCLELSDEENQELDEFLYRRFNGLEGDTSVYGFSNKKRYKLKLKYLVLHK